MEIKAELNFLRMSPRKVRLVADMIRGKKLADGLNIVKFSSRWASKPILKLLQSAAANAAHNFNLPKDNLYIKTIRVNQGPMLKRWSARAFGRAGEIQKKTSHVEIILGELKVADVKEPIVIDKKVKKDVIKTQEHKNIKTKAKTEKKVAVKKK